MTTRGDFESLTEDRKADIFGRTAAKLLNVQA